MKIVIPYENEEIFQHFGKAQQFKIYQVNEDSIVSSQVVSVEEQGHDALTGFLKESEVNVVICGGIGNMARFALTETKIQLMPGASGKADEAVLSFLNGNLHFDTGGGCGGCGGHSGEDGEGFIGACGHSCF